ncbi:hypothetical protein PG989_001344 [Apiospora arundinis]
MSSGFSEFDNARLRAPNLAWQPTALPDQPATLLYAPVAPFPDVDAAQVPLPAPQLEGLRAIRHYFLKDGRYAYEGRAGSGSYGSVYILRQAGGNQGSPNAGRRIAVKLIRRFRNPEYCDDPPVEEVEALEAFASAAHVVRTFGFKTFGGVDLYGVRQWVLLEYLEGGTWRDFEARVTKRGRALPNRMLWSIFRCLARIAIAMAYAEQTKDGPIQMETPTDGSHPQPILYNTDMHTNNLMFGSFGNSESEIEHRLSPIVKMIDLGSIERIDTSRDTDWNLQSENLISMVSNVFLNIYNINQRQLGSARSDPELKELLDVCTRRGDSTMRDMGWSFQDVDERVQRGFLKGPAQYQESLGVEDGTEDDEVVLAVVKELFFDAETTQGAPPGAADLDDLPNPLLHPDDSDLSI